MNLGFSGNKLTQKQADRLCKALWYYFERGFKFLHLLCQSDADEYAAKYWSKCGGKVWCHGNDKSMSQHCSVKSYSVKPDIDMQMSTEVLITTCDANLAPHANYVLEKD